MCFSLFFFCSCGTRGCLLRKGSVMDADLQRACHMRIAPTPRFFPPSNACQTNSKPRGIIFRAGGRGQRYSITHFSACDGQKKRDMIRRRERSMTLVHMISGKFSLLAPPPPNYFGYVRPHAKRYLHRRRGNPRC